MATDRWPQFLATTEEWVDRTITEVQNWDDLSPAGGKLAALERIAAQRHGIAIEGARSVEPFSGGPARGVHSE